MLRVTVIEWNALELHDSWPRLATHTRDHGSDLVVLPEMPFSPWLATSAEADPGAWADAVEVHDAWIARLGELGAATVVGSRPVTIGGRHFNEGFVWTVEEGSRPGHRKAYLPNEAGFWEAAWYERGPTTFEPLSVPAAVIGFQICTELWFMEHARSYGAAGVELLVCPRATPSHTLDKWVAGGRTGGVIAGAFSLSSNHSGAYEGVQMAGGGWVASPEGEVLALTSTDRPFDTVGLDLDVARAAKSTYPRYVDSSLLDD